TMHWFAVGNSWEELYEATKDNKVQLFHLNDIPHTVTLESRIDRHEQIGKGQLPVSVILPNNEKELNEWTIKLHSKINEGKGYEKQYKQKIYNTTEKMGPYDEEKTQKWRNILRQLIDEIEYYEILLNRVKDHVITLRKQDQHRKASIIQKLFRKRQVQKLRQQRNELEKQKQELDTLRKSLAKAEENKQKNQYATSQQLTPQR
ncbi:11044_t:CDS:2, partial [Ambispora gerdemannii]